MNKYKVEGIINEGAYGIVYKGRNKETGEYGKPIKIVVAIKKFKETDEDEVVKKTTMWEIKVLWMMKHPNIVELKEAFSR